MTLSYAGSCLLEGRGKGGVDDVRGSGCDGSGCGCDGWEGRCLVEEGEMVLVWKYWGKGEAEWYR